MPEQAKLGCNYQGYEFGAPYLDSVCIDGYLWDADSGCNGFLTSGGDIPCPECNKEAHAKWHECEFCKGDERKCDCQDLSDAEFEARFPQHK